MKRPIFLRYLQDSRVILGLILAVFFFKGVFLATIQPIFGGQDEARHYDTIQYLAQPDGAVSEEEKLNKRNNDALRDKDDFNTYNFSEEIQKTAEATDTDILRGEIYNTINFSDSSEGIHESPIREMNWKPYNYYTEPDIAGTNSLYHHAAAYIERFLAEKNILTRFYLIRIFSVLLGTFAVFLAYRIARTIGFSPHISLILTAILSFQPKFSLYFTNINYDVFLIPCFFLFTLGCVLALRDGLRPKNIALIIGATVLAIGTKGTGYILLPIIVVFFTVLLFERIKPQNRRSRYIVSGIGALMIISVGIYLTTHFLGTANTLGKNIGTIVDYIGKTITFGKFILPSGTYWGTLSWTRSLVIDNVTNIIFIIETIAIIGLGLLLFSKKFKEHYPTFLPAKKYILFLIGMIIALQLGIRTADWHVYSQIGGMKMSLGTPGRYFLPNLAAHILLLGTGIGAILAWFRKEEYFETALLAILILLSSLMMYLTFDVIILRFYF